MISQLLFGECVEIIESNDKWHKIKNTYDEYSGWVDKKQIVSISNDEFQEINSSKKYISTDLIQIIFWNQNQICPIVMGSSLPLYQEKKFHFNNTEYAFEGNVIDSELKRPEKLLDHAYMFLNAPYLWGGRTPLGIDCSGFTQMVFKICGIKLKRDSAQQAEQGELISMFEDSKPGDLAFFNNEEGKIKHVGIILPGNKIIHASGKVKLERFDHQGIFSEESGAYSHNLKMIKRIS